MADEHLNTRRSVIAASLAVEFARGAVGNIDIEQTDPQKFAARCIALAKAVVDQASDLASSEDDIQTNPDIFH